MLKRIPVDTNFNWFGHKYPGISHKEVEEMGLQVGEKVLATMEGEEWLGIVRFDPTLKSWFQWYVELLDESLEAPETQ